MASPTFCSECGTQVGAGHRFCQGCGAAVAVPSPPPSAPPQAVTPSAGPHGLALLVGMMFRPQEVLQQRAVSWPAALALSGAAFALFFLQTAIDRWRVGKAGVLVACGLPILGAFCGTAGVAALATVGWGLSRLVGGTRPYSWAVRAYALAYVPALLYGVLGLGANLLFRWHTAVAFGVTGVLRSLFPLMAVHDQLTGNRRALSVLLTTACGGIVLLGWGIMGTH